MSGVSALGSMVAACRRAGLLAWCSKGSRRGPRSASTGGDLSTYEIERLRAHMDELAAAGDATEVRNVAIARLLHNAALRVGEALGRFPDDVHLDGEAPAVSPRRKGRRERASVTIGSKAAESLRAWIALRGTWAGPLFVRLHDVRDDAPVVPLTRKSVRLMLAVKARQAGVRSAVRPHGLRHASASEIARRGSLDELQALGQWKSLSAAAHYIDQRDETRLRAVAIVEV